MKLERVGLQPIGLMVCAGLAILAFITGTVFGTVVLGWWAWPSPFATPTPSAPVDSKPESVGAATPTLPADAPCTQVPALTISVTPCVTPPNGWIPYEVKSGDTLSELALLSGVSQEQVVQTNCLTSPELWAGQVLFLPPLPTPTPCGARPPDWVSYAVKPGDTLSELAAQAGTSLEQVMQANCLTSLELWAEQVLYLPPLPTPSPTPCVPSPPLGWALTNIQPGDTLAGLAAVHGTTIEEIMEVNCLLSSEIMAGQALYLPSLAATPQPAQPQPTAEPVEPVLPQLTPQLPQPSPPQVTPQPFPTERALSRLDIPAGELPELPIPFGSPNEFVPCMGETGAQISVATGSSEEWKRGTRVYFYACGFAAPDTLSVQMIGPPPYDTPQSLADLLAVYSYPLTPELRRLDPDLSRINRDLDRGEGHAQAVVVWSAVCNLPSGPYTLTMQDDRGGRDDYTFSLPPQEDTHDGAILAIPQLASAGSPFKIYYCNYPPDNPLTVGIYYDFERVYNRLGILQRIVFGRLRTWTVTINGDGWAVEEIETFPHNNRGLYWLQDEAGNLKGEDKFWLHY